MLGASASSALLDTSLLDWVHPEHRANPHKLKLDVHTPRLEEKLLRLDGSVIDVEIMIRTIDYHGEPARQASMRDITERKVTAAALEAARLESEHASRSKSRFLASASHDLRQPAHALGMFVARLVELPTDA